MWLMVSTKSDGYSIIRKLNYSYQVIGVVYFHN